MTPPVAGTHGPPPAGTSESRGPDAVVHAHAKLRGDLAVSEQGTAGARSFVIKDPVAGRFFRFKEPEHFIAVQLDGETSLDVVQHRAAERFGATVAREPLVQFVEKLARLGLLEQDGAPREPAGHGQRRAVGGPLLLRVKVLNPDRLLASLDDKAGFLFTRGFLALSVAVVLAGGGIMVANAQEIGRDLLRAASVETLLLAWLVMAVVTTAHEVAHGLTCKHFGGAVHEIGFLLIYLQPAFYCNVSDAWLFPQKSKRLWVTFAGAYLEIVLWGLATLAWRVTEPGTAVSYVALIVMATSGIKTLFNLNPLIKLDGYYLLSDALGVPNLRSRSFSYLGARITRLWSAARPTSPEPAPRERRIYLGYGVLAAIFSFVLLGLIIVRLGEFLIGQYQAVGFLAFTGLLAVVFRAPLRKTARKAAALVRPRALTVAAWRRRAKALVLVAVIAVALFVVRMGLTVSGEFKILPMHNADVRAEVEGLVESVHVEEGGMVAAGAVIARLSQRDYAAEVRKTEAEIGEKQAKLKMLVAGPRSEEIALARDAVVTANTRVTYARARHVEAERMLAERRVRSQATVEKARERLTYADRLLAMQQTLFQRQLIALKQLIEAEEAATVRKKEVQEADAELKLVLADDLAEPRKTVAIAEKELLETQARLNILLAGSRPEEIEATRAEVARLEAQRRHAEERLRLVTIVSPITGVVTTPKLREKVGQHVNRGDVIANVQDLKTVTAEISVPEGEIGDVEVGQPVVVKARAYPERPFRGMVTAIGAAATREDGRGVVKVTTVIDNPAHTLKAELTGTAKIRGDERPLFDLMTRRLARYVRVEFWSWW